MSNERVSTPMIISDVAGANGFIGVCAPYEERLHPRHPTSPAIAKPRPRRAGARVAQAQAHGSWDVNILRSEGFAEAVHRETRRSERSGAPLSIVRYTIAERAAEDPAQLERLLDVLRKSRRETDYLGQTGTDSLALLCPDTDGVGAQGLTAKLAPLVADLAIEVATASFPEHLFEGLSGSGVPRPPMDMFVGQPRAVEKPGCYPLKRTLDILLALLALALLGPLMAVVASIVKLTSNGPVIFKQSRLGKGGVPFTFYKFRSMVVNVDDRIHREYMANLIRGGHGDGAAADASLASYKMKADPRVTRIGKFIRMTSIDELPQLFNVLKGDMSMVGPRPPIPYEAIHYEPWHLRRILVAKPGITGLWQVEGRSRVTFSEMVRMDLRYIRDCSLALDLKLLVRTVGVVVRGSGAR
jgi:lipopolysaccharide/colanic/teichoic acid biosynthesis glycosyltransferase